MANPISKLNLVINGVTTQLDIHDANAVDLTSNQTVGGDKEFTGTTTAHDVIPSATDTYNFGSSSAQWNNAYIKALNGKTPAYDTDVIHIKGADDIIDSKTFISLYTQSSGPSLWMKNTSFTMGTAPTTNRYSGIWVQDNNGTDTAYIVHQANKNNSQNLKFSVSNTDGTTVYQNALAFQGRLDGTFNFYSDNPANLGTSTNKWKSFNGINPGALSLPGTSVNVDTTNWVLDGSNTNIFTPASDGWLGIQVTDTVYDQMHYVFVGRTGGGNAYYSQNVLSPINALWDSKYHGCIFIPVVKNVNYDIRCICSTIVATFYPCQGSI